MVRIRIFVMSIAFGSLMAANVHAVPAGTATAKYTGAVHSHYSKKKRYKRRYRRHSRKRYRRGRRVSSRRHYRRYRRSRRIYRPRYVRPGLRALRATSVAILNQNNGNLLYGKNIHERRSIASVTKLMTAIVVLDARLRLDQPIRISYFDKDFIKFSRSRLPVGTLMRRKDLLFMALAASENRASHALARTYPGGKKAFIRAMNKKAQELGMKNTHFTDSSGLSASNKSTAADLLKLVAAAYKYPTIREMTTTSRSWAIDLSSGRIIQFNNTNRLVRRGNWNINLSKTGFIREAGYCLVMHTSIRNKNIIMVILNSSGKWSKFGDANRVRKWLTGKYASFRSASSKY